ncbi:SgcJ/EcaC family oxidoreductase [Solwaraspora sp. WMMD406]|uniref:SgcJ/EcaC family oxidoreductase n=1 Tax=Solwaraspora sp. WMMD406 TaxID=3016095 RepID=UPI002417D8C6|nr:SgcJ/EcaC family oxidoreductase [Solwaraspora sp. WMMD406]MDG4766928.1 SgcJ/EcaC family oxidoreductase [Solwaraspora sp. WMMD406]
MTTKTGWGDASTILAEAGIEEDTSYYRNYEDPDERAALTVPMRIQAAWAANDADAFADLFAENGSLLMRDDQLTSREEIREFMSKAFAGPHRGARVKGWPIEITFLSDEAVMVVTEGGIIHAGESDIAPENLIRACWVIAKRPDGRLELMSHQSSPIKN